jgi:hypothetical protein
MKKMPKYDERQQPKIGISVRELKKIMKTINKTAHLPPMMYVYGIGTASLGKLHLFGLGLPTAGK